MSGQTWPRHRGIGAAHYPAHEHARSFAWSRGYYALERGPPARSRRRRRCDGAPTLPSRPSRGTRPRHPPTTRVVGRVGEVEDSHQSRITRLGASSAPQRAAQRRCYVLRSLGRTISIKVQLPFESSSVPQIDRSRDTIFSLSASAKQVWSDLDLLPTHLRDT